MQSNAVVVSDRTMDNLSIVKARSFDQMLITLPTLWPAMVKQNKHKESIPLFSTFLANKLEIGKYEIICIIGNKLMRRHNVLHVACSKKDDRYNRIAVLAFLHKNNILQYSFIICAFPHRKKYTF